MLCELVYKKGIYMKNIKKIKKIIAFVLVMAIVVSMIDARTTKAENVGM